MYPESLCPLCPSSRGGKNSLPKAARAVTARWHVCPAGRCRWPAAPGPGRVRCCRPPAPPRRFGRGSCGSAGPGRAQRPPPWGAAPAARAILGTRRGQPSPSLRKMAAAGWVTCPVTWRGSPRAPPRRAVSMAQPDTRAAAARDGRADGASAPARRLLCLRPRQGERFPLPGSPASSPEGSASSFPPAEAAGAPGWGGRGGGPFAAPSPRSATRRVLGRAGLGPERPGPSPPLRGAGGPARRRWREVRAGWRPPVAPHPVPRRAGERARCREGRRAGPGPPPFPLGGAEGETGEEGGWRVGRGVRVSLGCVSLPPSVPPAPRLFSFPLCFPSPPHLLQACGTVAVWN